MITNKYFEAFNFYMAKSINEILANISVPNAILFRDINFNDPETEYLKEFNYINHATLKLKEVS